MITDDALSEIKRGYHLWTYDINENQGIQK